MDTILNLRGKNTATVKVSLWRKKFWESPTGGSWGLNHIVHSVPLYFTFENVALKPRALGARRSKVSSHALDLYARHGTCLHFCTRTSKNNLVLSRQEGMDRWSCSKRILAWIIFAKKCHWMFVIATHWDWHVYPLMGCNCSSCVSVHSDSRQDSGIVHVWKFSLASCSMDSAVQTCGCTCPTWS